METFTGRRSILDIFKCGISDQQFIPPSAFDRCVKNMILAKPLKISILASGISQRAEIVLDRLDEEK